jgi:PPOX class probable F420-dependent enzyme
MSLDIHQFDKSNYINLETYRKNGSSVITPVWFVTLDKNFFVITKSDTGKVKRLRNNPKLRICPCDFRGKVKGQWLNGLATLKTPDAYPQIIRLRNKKYGFRSKLVSLFTRAKGTIVIICIELA